MLTKQQRLQYVLHTTCRIGLSQWKKNWASLLIIIFGFLALLLIQSIQSSVKERVALAAKHISPNQVWINHFGRSLSAQSSRYLLKSLQQFGTPHALYIEHDVLENAQDTLSFAWLYTYQNTLETLHFAHIPQQIPPSMALSTWDPKVIPYLNLNHKSRNYHITATINNPNEAFRAFSQSESFVWVPMNKELDFSTVLPSHFIISDVSPEFLTPKGLEAIKRSLKTVNPISYTWDVKTPMKIIEDKFKPNAEILFFFWCMSLIAMASGGINFFHILMFNIKERRHEIALRIMLGARAKDLMLQFILEVFTIISFCLILACLICPIICHVLIKYFDIPLTITYLPSYPIILSCIGMSLIFSSYPAYLAISTNPKKLFNPS